MTPACERVTLTSRLRSNAVIHAPKPPKTGKRGRLRVKGERLGSPGEIAARSQPSAWEELDVPGRAKARVLVVKGLWHSVFGPRVVQVVIVREPDDAEGYRIALITTDAEASAGAIIARYAERWSIEVAFQDAKHVLGVGEARNRVRRAVERTVPFGFLCQTIAVACTRSTRTWPPTSQVGGEAPRGTAKSKAPRCSRIVLCCRPPPRPRRAAAR